MAFSALAYRKVQSDMESSMFKSHQHEIARSNWTIAQIGEVGSAMMRRQQGFFTLLAV